MNLYLISQQANNAYDTYDSAVIVANNSTEAKQFTGLNSETHDTWTTPDNVTVTKLGIASPFLNAKAGTIICSSFNAG